MGVLWTAGEVWKRNQEGRTSPFQVSAPPSWGSWVMRHVGSSSGVCCPQIPFSGRPFVALESHLLIPIFSSRDPTAIFRGEKIHFQVVFFLHIFTRFQVRHLRKKNWSQDNLQSKRQFWRLYLWNPWNQGSTIQNYLSTPPEGRGLTRLM